MDVDISGAKVLFTLPIDLPILGPLAVSETIVVSWVVLLILTVLCLWLTHDLKVEKISKRQAVAEMLVELANMGERFRYFVPFVAALFATGVCSNLISLFGVRSPTADLDTELAWAVIVFILITKQKIQTNGLGGYLLDYTKPIPILAPFNVLSEIATPIGMSFRHFGNILSGVVINTLLYTALAMASSKLLGLIPGVVGAVLSQIPILDVGIPAILSFYFDWLSGLLQPLIFSMLTVMFIANAAEES